MKEITPLPQAIHFRMSRWKTDLAKLLPKNIINLSLWLITLHKMLHKPHLLASRRIPRLTWYASHKNLISQPDLLLLEKVTLTMQPPTMGSLHRLGPSPDWVIWQNNQQFATFQTMYPISAIQRAIFRKCWVGFLPYNHWLDYSCFNITLDI